MNSVKIGNNIVPSLHVRKGIVPIMTKLETKPYFSESQKWFVAYL